MGAYADVYVAGSLRNATREWWKIYEKIGAVVEEAGMTAHVPHIHTAGEVGSAALSVHDPEIEGSVRAKVFDKNWSAVQNAKLLIAEITQPSVGTGMEIGLALKMNKPVICLVRNGTNITSMVMGPAHLGIIDVIKYDAEEEGLSKLKQLLEKKYAYLRNHS